MSDVVNEPGGDDGSGSIFDTMLAALRGVLSPFWVGASTLVVAMYLGLHHMFFWLVSDFIVGFLDIVTELVIENDIRIPPLADNLQLPVELLGVANYYVPLVEGAILFALYYILAFSVWTVRLIIKLVPTVG